MISFESDYVLGAHEKILELLLETNTENLSGYGEDPYCRRAKEKIRALCRCPDADIYFFTSGTQTNQTIIDAMLQPYEGVIAAATGHINVHEAGAIEFTGHKVLAVPQEKGKIQADTLQDFLKTFYGDSSHEHMVFPRMVYLSHPTEYGTLYSLEELKEISQICKQYDLFLYVDGARLGYGLMSPENNVTLPDLAALCDVFYIGGTKVGSLCGEAAVFPRHNAPKHFVTIMKQHGALAAKGRLLGVQFDALFTDGLYFQISRHAIEMADRMREIFRQKEYRFFVENSTNQIFIVLENEKMEELQKSVGFSFWEKFDESHTVVRFASSWATTMEEIDLLAKVL